MSLEIKVVAASSADADIVGELLISRAREFARGRAWEVLEVGAPDVPRCQRTVDLYLENGFSEVDLRLEMAV
jgi:hypothetical protein